MPRGTTISSLLVDHPCLPVPEVHGSKLATAHRPGLARERLSRQQRLRWAAELTAACVLLVDLGYWPTLTGIRRSRVMPREQGGGARLGALPLDLNEVERRLGGGEAAAVHLRDRALQAILATCGVAAPPQREIDGEPGFFLDPLLQGLLEQLTPESLESVVPCLWASRWLPPPLPSRGELVFWSVPKLDSAQRLGAALTLRARRQGMAAVLQQACADDMETAPLPVIGRHGLLVLVGSAQPEELRALERWTSDGDHSAVVLGRFPRGWEPPPPPVIDPSALPDHLSIAGIPRQRSYRLLDRRRGRFHPLVRADAEALTSSIAAQFPEPRRRVGTGGPQSPPLKGILELLPEGLPEGFVSLHSGLSGEEIRRQAELIGAVLENGSWRLPNPARLRPHTLHAEVAGLFPPHDPRHLLHLALAGADVRTLNGWLVERLQELDSTAVRELLHDLTPGALGPAIDEALLQACLVDQDPGSARRLLDALPPERRELWRPWLDAVDGDPAQPATWRGPDADHLPDRVRAELALLELKKRLRRGAPCDAVRHELRLVGARLGGRVRELVTLRQLSLEQPHLLDTIAARRELVGGHPVLRRHLWHERAVHHTDQGRLRLARRILRRLLRTQAPPGVLGLLRVDLAVAEADLGLLEESERNNLRALRLLQTVGFRFRIRNVYFNLAVSDLDHLRVAAAERRFALADCAEGDLGAAAELTRWALATGRLEEFRQHLQTLRQAVHPAHARVFAGLRFLEGVEALLEHELERASACFAEGGAEAVAWQQLCRVLAGGSTTPGSRDDGWGVALAARRLDEAARGPAGAAPHQGGRPSLRDAFGLALLEVVAGPQDWCDEETRWAAENRLREAGLAGWAEKLAAVQNELPESYVECLASLLDSDDPSSIATAELRGLLQALGLQGLELRSAVDGRVLWSWGQGSRGTPHAAGPLLLVPLGGEVRDGARWRVFTRILADLAPPAHGAPGPGTSERTGLHGTSPAMVALRAEIERFAPTSIPVVVLGETGTGKERVARALHRLSGRRGAFQAVNVAGVAGTLLESELFGSVRGAFTGADRDRQGVVGAAEGGTLFLDEIGDLDISLQAKLLRFLESHEVRPVGSDTSHQVDVRVVSATHRDLETRVASGTFRQDLYYRVAQAIIPVPPLRERREDIPLLCDLFEREFCGAENKPRPRWTPSALQRLQDHAWPGNVRELQSVVTTAVIRARGGSVHDVMLGLGEAPKLSSSGTWEQAKREFQRQFFREALERHDGNRSAAARDLGVSRQTLLYHINRLDLDRPRAKK